MSEEKQPDIIVGDDEPHAEIMMPRPVENASTPEEVQQALNGGM